MPGTVCLGETTWPPAFSTLSLNSSREGTLTVLTVAQSFSRAMIASSMTGSPSSSVWIVGVDLEVNHSLHVRLNSGDGGWVQGRHGEQLVSWRQDQRIVVQRSMILPSVV
jgi:hypothetical protein